jgi:hypothetical protein
MDGRPGYGGNNGAGTGRKCRTPGGRHVAALPVSLTAAHAAYPSLSRPTQLVRRLLPSFRPVLVPSELSSPLQPAVDRLFRRIEAALGAAPPAGGDRGGRPNADDAEPAAAARGGPVQAKKQPQRRHQDGDVMGKAAAGRGDVTASTGAPSASSEALLRSLRRATDAETQLFGYVALPPLPQLQPQPATTTTTTTASRAVAAVVNGSAGDSALAHERRDGSEPLPPLPLASPGSEPGAGSMTGDSEDAIGDGRGDRKALGSGARRRRRRH